ncbi:MAG: DNA polymerase III subunit alpha, partial [Proteobacteria bacterium]|nr:DNA polymerase III subunit alpha [Pseudomonadota bacterium]
ALAMEAAEQAAANAMQSGLFDALPEAAGAAVEFVAARPWAERDRLKEEKLAIGFFLSGHPFDACKDEVRRFVRQPLAQLTASRDPVMLAGIVMEVRYKVGARGKMAFILLDDGTLPREVTVYSETLDACRDKIAVDEVLVIEGKASDDEFSGGLRIVADHLMNFSEARARFARGLSLRLDIRALNGTIDTAINRLSALLEPFRADVCPVRVSVRNGQAEGDLALGDPWRVKPDDALLENLREWLSPGAVGVMYGD